MLGLSECIEQFLNECRFQRRLDQKTINAYSIDMKQFYEYSHESSYVEREVILSYIEHINGMYKPSTVKRKLACLRSFFSYLEYEDMIERSPFAKIRLRMREPLILPKHIPLNGIEEILSYAYDKLRSEKEGSFGYNTSLRNVIILELLFMTGVRVSELCSISPKDIDKENCEILIWGKGSRYNLYSDIEKDKTIVFNTLYGAIALLNMAEYGLSGNHTPNRSDLSSNNLLKL